MSDIFNLHSGYTKRGKVFPVNNFPYSYSSLSIIITHIRKRNYIPYLIWCFDPKSLTRIINIFPRIIKSYERYKYFNRNFFKLYLFSSGLPLSKNENFEYM